MGNLQEYLSDLRTLLTEYQKVAVETLTAYEKQAAECQKLKEKLETAQDAERKSSKLLADFEQTSQRNNDAFIQKLDELRTDYETRLTAKDEELRKLREELNEAQKTNQQLTEKIGTLSTKSYERKAESAEEKAKATEKELEKLQSTMSTINESLEGLKKGKQIDILKQQIAEKDKRIQVLEEKLEQQTEAFNSQIGETLEKLQKKMDDVENIKETVVYDSLESFLNATDDENEILRSSGVMCVIGNPPEGDTSDNFNESSESDNTLDENSGEIQEYTSQKEPSAPETSVQPEFPAQPVLNRENVLDYLGNNDSIVVEYLEDNGNLVIAYLDKNQSFLVEYLDNHSDIFRSGNCAYDIFVKSVRLAQSRGQLDSILNGGSNNG